MTNYSRTTLRELKKRYLNILKKCLLANLLAFSFVLPAGAEVTWDENGNGYDIVKGTEENPVDLTANSTYSSFSGSGPFNDLSIQMDNVKTNQTAFFDYGTNNEEEITVNNIDLNIDNLDAYSTTRLLRLNGKGGNSLLNINKYSANISGKGISREFRDILLLGLYAYEGDIYVKNKVNFDISNFSSKEIHVVRTQGVSDLSIPELNVKLDNIKTFSENNGGSIVGVFGSWITKQKIDIGNFNMTIKNSDIANSLEGVAFGSYGELYIGGMTGTPTNSDDLNARFGNIEIQILGTKVNTQVIGVSAIRGHLFLDKLYIKSDENSIVNGDVIGCHFIWSNTSPSTANFGDIEIDISGNILGSIKGINAINTEKISAKNITFNLNDAQINKDIIGTVLRSENLQTNIEKFDINVTGNSVIQGSLQTIETPETNNYSVDESILTIYENSSLTVGSIDVNTKEYEGEITLIDEIDLEEKSLLVGAIDTSNKADVNVNMKIGSKLKIMNNSNLHTLNSNNGFVDLSQTTSDTTINIQELEGEGTTILTDSTEVAKTTIGNNKSKKLTVAATSKLNDEVNNSEMLANSLAKIVNIQEGEKDLTLAAEEGRIQGQMTAELKDGSVKNLQVKANTVTESVKDVMGLQVLSFRNQINDVQKRMGDLRLDENTKGTWVRTFGGDVKFGDMGLKNKYNTIQAGADFKKGNAYFGIMATLTEGESDMDRGTGEDKTYGMGVYAGYMTDNGWYVDATAKQMHLQNKFKARYNTGELSRGSYKTWGTSVSLEAGKRMNLPCGFFVEPQAEIMYGRVQGIDYTTSAGVKVEQEAFESLIGRAGLSVGKTFKDKGSVYANVSVLNDFAGKVKTSFSYWNQETKTRDDMGGAWTEFAIGGTYKLNKNTALYGEFATSKGTDLTNPVQWSLGLRFSF